MTPEEFAAKMKAILVYEGWHDIERDHCEADDLMCEALRSLGYGEGVSIFLKTELWYS